MAYLPEGLALEDTHTSHPSHHTYVDPAEDMGPAEQPGLGRCTLEGVDNPVPEVVRGQGSSQAGPLHAAEVDA
jgi:hypothetical protein